MRTLFYGFPSVANRGQRRKSIGSQNFVNCVCPTMEARSVVKKTINRKSIKL